MKQAFWAAIVLAAFLALACGKSDPEVVPDAPIISRAEVLGVGAGSIGFRFYWNDISGADYLVLRRTDSGLYRSLDVTSSAFYTDHITAGAHWYKLRARNSTGESGDSGEIALQVSSENEGRVKKGYYSLGERHTAFISWSRNLVGSDAVTIKVYRWSSLRGEYELLGELATDQNYINDAEFSPNIDSLYIVSTVDENGRETDIAEVTVTFL